MAPLPVVVKPQAVVSGRTVVTRTVGAVTRGVVTVDAGRNDSRRAAPALIGAVGVVVCTTGAATIGLRPRMAGEMVCTTGNGVKLLMGCMTGNVVKPLMLAVVWSLKDWPAVLVTVRVTV